MSNILVLRSDTPLDGGGVESKKVSIHYPSPTQHHSPSLLDGVVGFFCYLNERLDCKRGFSYQVRRPYNVTFVGEQHEVISKNQEGLLSITPFFTSEDPNKTRPSHHSFFHDEATL